MICCLSEHFFIWGSYFRVTTPMDRSYGSYGSYLFCVPMLYCETSLWEGSTKTAAVGFYKTVFLKISLNSQENTCARALFLIELQVGRLQLYWKRENCFSVNFAKFLRTPFLQNTSGRLLLAVGRSSHQRCSMCHHSGTGVFL